MFILFLILFFLVSISSSLINERSKSKTTIVESSTSTSLPLSTSSLIVPTVTVSSTESTEIFKIPLPLITTDTTLPVFGTENDQSTSSSSATTTTKASSNLFVFGSNLNPSDTKSLFNLTSNLSSSNVVSITTSPVTQNNFQFNNSNYVNSAFANSKSLPFSFTTGNFFLIFNIKEDFRIYGELLLAFLEDTISIISFLCCSLFVIKVELFLLTKDNSQCS